MVLCACSLVVGCTFSTRTFMVLGGSSTKDAGDVVTDCAVELVAATADDASLPMKANSLQTCFDRAVTSGPGNVVGGEGVGVLSAANDARRALVSFLPQANGTGAHRIRVEVFAETGASAGRFGWYDADSTPFDAGQRHEIFGCRDLYRFQRRDGLCQCPCGVGTRSALPPPSQCLTWHGASDVEIDFDCYAAAGRWHGGPVGFYYLTVGPPWGRDCIEDNADSGVAMPSDALLFSTTHAADAGSSSPQFLLWESRVYASSYYLGWEDLPGGGDLNFQDMIVRITGVQLGCPGR